MVPADGCIVVTGAGGGVGCQVAGHLLHNGWRNIALVCRRRKDEAEKLLAASRLPADKHLYLADLSDEQSVHQLAADISERLGPVAGLLNIAGSSSNGMSWKLSLEDVRRVIDDSFISTFLCTRAFLPGMRQRRLGAIINAGSIVGNTGAIGAAHYAAAKAAVAGFTKSVAREAASSGVTVNAVALGYFDCGLFEEIPAEIQNDIRQAIPLGRLGSASDLAIFEFLLTGAASYITGQTFHVNGGLYLA